MGEVLSLVFNHSRVFFSCMGDKWTSTNGWWDKHTTTITTTTIAHWAFFFFLFFQGQKQNDKHNDQNHQDIESVFILDY